MIYEDERITVTESGSKVRITDKFTFETMTINRASFEKMCKEVAGEKATADIWE